MIAIIKREISSYFTSAIGYTVLAIMYLLSGFFFYGTCLMANRSSLTYVFSDMLIAVLILVPVLTMRLVSEEKRQKTDQALFTAPVSLTSIALGKYFSALIVFVIAVLPTLLFAFVIRIFTIPDWTSILCNFIGLILLGGAFIAVGMFISSLTDKQAVAVFITLGVSILIFFLDAIANIVPISFISNALSSISFMNHYTNFTMGILSVVDILFFVSVAAAFIFLTVRVFEKRRWS